MFILAAILFVAAILFFATCKIATQYERAVVFRLGRYVRTAGPGLYFLIPFIEWRVKINAVIWRRTVNPKLAVIEVANVGNSVVQVAVTALRNVIGQHSLDEVLKEQAAVSEALQNMIDVVTEPWGVKVERVQMKDVEIPETMQRAMAQEAEALREKRTRQIKAEAEVDAARLLRQAAETIMQSPAGLELRRMQMITEVGAEQNTMTIIMMPSEFVEMARAIGASAARRE
ncbi:MAG: SPFH domain-containing protein [Methylovirgula sp.]|uniref:SPFH domain-containing protein n=1 Tax=Methylovirgula sp. TaxID=1978224 RepID=UPI0030760C5B